MKARSEIDFEIGLGNPVQGDDHLATALVGLTQADPAIVEPEQFTDKRLAGVAATVRVEQGRGLDPHQTADMTLEIPRLFQWPVETGRRYLEGVGPLNRILDLENPSQEVIASDQKRLVVDAFARYRITNPLRFYQSVGTVQGANQRLSTVLNSSLRRVLGENAFITVVRDERESLMRQIGEQVNREARNFGIDVVDVRIRRADLPEANSQAVFQRMQTERQREAAEIRAQGNEAAQRTRARAEREATIVVAEATSKGEQLRGEGDGERNRIFADAFGRDPDFFAFYRSMQAYEASMKAGDTRMLVSPDSSFFRYFRDPSGAASPAPPPARPAPIPAPAAAN